jgi:hypothetical protein
MRPEGGTFVGGICWNIERSMDCDHQNDLENRHSVQCGAAMRDRLATEQDILCRRTNMGSSQGIIGS